MCCSQTVQNWSTVFDSHETCDYVMISVGPAVLLYGVVLTELYLFIPLSVTIAILLSNFLPVCCE